LFVLFVWHKSKSDTSSLQSDHWMKIPLLLSTHARADGPTTAHSARQISVAMNRCAHFRRSQAQGGERASERAREERPRGARVWHRYG
jgi:hypothetical protein